MIIALDARPLVTRQVGGAEQRARNILAAWIHDPQIAAREHHFHLLYERLRGSAFFDDSLLADLPGHFHRQEISSYHMPSRHHIGSRLLNSLSRALGRIKPDVYHSFTTLVPRTTVCPVVPTIHDLSFDLDPVVRQTPAGRELRRVTRRSIDYADRLIAVSSQTKSDIASIYRVAPERIDVVYNGIDPVFSPTTDLPVRAAVHLANHITGSYLLAVGADIPRRNYSRMLAAMQLVWAGGAGSKVKWVLAGRDDWKLSAIYSQARAAGVLDRLRFVSSPTNADLANLYRCAAITCCASSFEGFGLSVLESMACGTAVACSDMRSLREVAEDAALYFPHDDAQAMGLAIAGLLEDAEYRRQLKYRGLYRAGLFTWSTAAQLTLQSLAAVLANV